MFIPPNVPSYASRSAYVTYAEFLASPTGVDVSNLSPGSGLTSETVLTQLLAQASSWADGMCRQVLSATTNTQYNTSRLRPDGTVRIPIKYTPLVAVTAMTVAVDPNCTPTTVDLTTLSVDDLSTSVRVPVTGCLYVCPGATVYTTTTYVNGFANTALAAPAAAGDASITVTDATGMVPGLQLTITDAVHYEQQSVAAGYEPAATALPLDGPLSCGYAAGTPVSALPPAVKQAVIFLATALIQTRRADSLEMGGIAMPGPAATVGSKPSGDDPYSRACDLLAPYRRVI